jgi:hypothetical protein
MCCLLRAIIAQFGEQTVEYGTMVKMISRRKFKKFREKCAPMPLHLP